uniref:bZIP transcription factor 12-like n=1 Tax=Erigeron canadensis TaxID=72917 RepID=UPI001CB8CFC2|nr:bZIP transcription factor 12-like [Erigeron canadensis]
MASSKVMATTSPANQDRTRHQSFVSSDHNNDSNNFATSMNMDDLLKNIYDQSPASFPANDGTGDPEMTLEDYLTKAGGVREEDAGVKLALVNSEYSGVIDPIMCAGDGAMTVVPFQGVPRQQQHMQFATGGGGRGKRKIVVEDRPVDKATQQKQRRMIKNRESAARSRERKQAYTVELESLVTQLEEEHARLLKEVDDLNKERLKQLMNNLRPVVENQRPPRVLRRTNSM